MKTLSYTLFALFLVVGFSNEAYAQKFGAKNAEPEQEAAVVVATPAAQPAGGINANAASYSANAPILFLLLSSFLFSLGHALLGFQRKRQL